MADQEITTLIAENLKGKDREVALFFTEFLQSQSLSLIRDRGFWKDKIYYIVNYQDKGVCYIAVGDPDEPENRWTVWSDDIDCTDQVDDAMEETALKYVDRCGHCGSCGGGRRKQIFGHWINDVCGCTFGVDNPGEDELPFLKKIVELRMDEIRVKHLENGVKI